MPDDLRLPVTRLFLQARVILRKRHSIRYSLAIKRAGGQLMSQMGPFQTSTHVTLEVRFTRGKRTSSPRPLRSEKGHKLKSSFNQMETPTHLSLNCTDGAISKPSFCLSVQGHSN
jgi:hypothetical protein